VFLVLYVVKCQNIFFLLCCIIRESLKTEELPVPIRFFTSPDSASLRPALLRMTINLRGGRSVHEQVPNTNIKFICPQFREKLLYTEGRQSMNSGPAPTSTSFMVPFRKNGSTWQDVFNLRTLCHTL
jgi:hypothetical protein